MNVVACFPVSYFDYDHLHLKLIFLKHLGQGKIMQSYRRLKKLWSRRNMFPDIILFFIYKCVDLLHKYYKITCTISMAI